MVATVVSCFASVAARGRLSGRVLTAEASGSTGVGGAGEI